MGQPRTTHDDLRASVNPQPAPASESARSSVAFVAAGAALAAVVAYGVSVRFGFVHDDAFALVGNPVVTGRLPLTGLFTRDYWGLAPGTPDAVGSWRPLTSALFTLLWWAGGGAAWPFHALSVAAHATASALFGVFACRLLAERRAALGAALLFATHALHGDAVASAIGAAESLATAFVLGATLLRARGGRGDEARALGLVVLAACTKESAALAPALLLAAEVGREGVSRGALRRAAAASVAVGVVLLVRALTLGGLAGWRPVALSNPLVREGPLVRALTAARLFGLGARRMAWPSPLSCDYGASAPEVRAGFDAEVLFGVATLVGLVALGVWAYRRRNAAALAGAVWWVLPGVGACGAFRLLPVVFAERFWYVPTMGACLLAGAALAALRVGTRTRVALAVAPALVMLPLAVTSGLRWTSEEALYTSSLRARPTNAVMSYNLGALYADRGDLPRALARCTDAARFAPRWGTPVGCRAATLQRMGRSEEAVTAWREMFTRASTSPHWWLWGVRALARAGHVGEARAALVRLRAQGYRSAASDRLAAQLGVP